MLWNRLLLWGKKINHIISFRRYDRIQSIKWPIRSFVQVLFSPHSSYNSTMVARISQSWPVADIIELCRIKRRARSVQTYDWNLTYPHGIYNPRAHHRIIRMKPTARWLVDETSRFSPLIRLITFDHFFIFHTIHDCWHLNGRRSPTSCPATMSPSVSISTTKPSEQ